MKDRLFVAVVGDRNSGKSTTWNTLFDETVKTGKKVRRLSLTPSRWAAVRLANESELVDHERPDSDGNGEVSVFLISGSNEEKRRYAQEVLENVDCRIVLCSVQYAEEAFERTWDFVFESVFAIYAQWLNPGHDGKAVFDGHGLMNRLLAHQAVISIRDGRNGKAILEERVEELRQYIHGWAAARQLVRPAKSAKA